MTLTRKQILSVVLLFGLVFVLPLVILLTQRMQDIRPKALSGKANFLLSSDSNSSSVGQNINVLVSLQLTDPLVRVSGVDFVLLYDKNNLEAGNIVPEITSIDANAAFTDAPIVTSGGNFDNQFNYLRVSEVARKPNASLAGGTVKLARVTFRGKSTGAAIIKFPDDNKYLEVVGITTNVPYVSPTGGGPTVTPGGPSVTPGSNTTGLVAYYKFDETAGTSAADSSGNNLTGTATAGTAVVAGKVNQARNISGGANNINIGNNALLNLTSAYTLSAWVYLTGNCTGGSGALFISKAQYGSYKGGFDWGCLTEAGYTNRMYLINQDTVSQDTYRSKYNMSANAWHHIAATFGGNQPKLYVDGNAVPAVFDGAAATMRNPAANTNNVYIGNQNVATSLGVPGYMDEVKIFNRVLSPAEIVNEVTSNGGTVPTMPPQPTAPPAGSNPAPTSSSSNNQSGNTQKEKDEKLIGKDKEDQAKLDKLNELQHKLDSLSGLDELEQAILTALRNEFNLNDNDITNDKVKSDDNTDGADWSWK